MATPKVPSTAAPKYIHPIQPVATEPDDLKVSVASNEQLHVADSLTVNNVIDAEGEIISFDPLPAQVFKPVNAGVVVLPTITDNGNGTLTIGDGRASFWPTHDEHGVLRWYDIEGDTITLTDSNINFVYYDYNSGTPDIKCTTDRETVCDSNLMTKVIIGTYRRSGTTIEGMDWDLSGVGLIEKRLNRAFDTDDRFSRSRSEGGLIITDTGDLHFQVSAGKVWTPVYHIDLEAVISYADVCLLYYKDSGGNWQKSIVTGFNNTQYQSESGLTTLTANRFAVNWVYRKVSATSKSVCIILGTGDYRLIDAQASYAPDAPAEVVTFGILVGRIIVEKNAPAATQIDNLTTAGSSRVPVTIHNDLSLRDATACHPASSIQNTPYQNILTTDQQSVNNELEDMVLHRARGLNETADGNKTFSGIFTVSNTTEASAYTTASALFHGGVGIAKKLILHGAFSGEDTTEASDYSTASATFAGGVGIAKKLILHGAFTGEDTTDASSYSAASATFAGGVGIAKSLIINGTTKCNDATDATSSSTASVVLDGGLAVAKKIINGDSTAGSNSTTGSVVTPGGFASAKASYLYAAAYGILATTYVDGQIHELADEAQRLRTVGTDTHFVTGFVDRTSSTVTVSTRTFTVAPVSTDFAYYLNNFKTTKTGGGTCQTTCPDAVGLHYIYFDSDSQLQNSMTPWVFGDDVVFVALGYWNGSAMARFEERHGAGRDVKLHEYLHKTRGTAYNSGFTKTYPTASDGLILQVESGIIFDEDIQLSIAQQKRCRYWYQTTDGAWIWAQGVDNGGYDYPVLWNSGTGRVQFPNSSSGYALTDAGPGAFLNVWAYATNDMDYPIALIIPSLAGAAYSTQAAAEAEAQPVLDLTPEMKLLYRWTYSGNGTYISQSDYRNSSPMSGGASGGSIPHNNTTSIQGGTTGEYYHLTSAQYTLLTAYTTVGGNLLSLANPSAVRFIRINADNTVSALSDSDFRTAIGAGTSSTTGTVTSVAMTVPTGLSVSGTPITSSGTLQVTLATGYSIPTTASQSNWDTAYTDRLKWDGGATGLTAATGRTSLGATTVGGSVFTLTNPSAVTFLRVNADNTVSALSASDFRTAIDVPASSATIDHARVMSRISMGF